MNALSRLFAAVVLVGMAASVGGCCFPACGQPKPPGVAWEFPPVATNPIGTPHKFTTKVKEARGGAPLAGYEVTYKITSGPSGKFEPGPTVKTDGDGLASVTLIQSPPAEGVNTVQVEIVQPAGEGKGSARTITGMTRKTWIGPKIAITKRAPPTALANQPFDYDIVVNNPSQVATTNTVLADTLPPGIQYVSSKPEAKVDGQNLTWPLGTLSPGQSSAAKVTVKGAKNGKFTNTARVTADFGLAAQAAADTVIALPALSATEVGPAEVLLCQPITYTLTVTNTGDAPATNVKLEDKLPDGLLYQDKQTSVITDFATLKPGESKKVEYAVTASKTGTFTNSAVVTGDGGLTASAQVKTTVRQPMLAITTDVPKVRYTGLNVTSTITVSNKGDGAAENTQLSVTLPAGATFVSASDNGRRAGSNVTWTLGTLAANQSGKVTVVVKANVIGEIQTFASASCTCSKASAKGVTEIKGVPGLLLEMVDVTDPVAIGDQETYVVTVTNQGTADCTNIVTTCTIPDEQEYLSSGGDTKGKADGRKVTFDPVKTLAPKAKAVFKVATKALKEGDSRFKVSITSDQTTSPVEKTESTHIFSDR